jgi:hypothetical protein
VRPFCKTIFSFYQQSMRPGSLCEKPVLVQNLTFELRLYRERVGWRTEYQL